MEAADYAQLGESLARFMGDHPYCIDALLADLVRFKSISAPVPRSTALSRLEPDAATQRYYRLSLAHRAWPAGTLKSCAARPNEGLEVSVLLKQPANERASYPA
jgi:hypothetical protein